MKGMLFQPLLKYIEENGSEEEQESKEKSVAGEETKGDELDEIAEPVQCADLQKRETTAQGEELSWEKYEEWRQEQKLMAARLEKNLKSSWAVEETIHQQLHSYHAHFNRAILPARLKDVARLLIPEWAQPQELASLAWLGDWRPSAVLSLLHTLARFSPSFSASHTAIQRLLPRLIRELRVEETVVEEEMAEIQATCVLHLPFMNHRSGGAALRCVQSEFNKIHQVIVKAQNLRFKALEMVVKNVLSQTDAAKFLVAFAGIQESIRQLAAHQRLRKGPVSVPVKPLEVYSYSSLMLN